MNALSLNANLAAENKRLRKEIEMLKAARLQPPYTTGTKNAIVWTPPLDCQGFEAQTSPNSRTGKSKP